ncbi:ABC transporter ATP-binding protein [Atopobacter phocae]|uniref:ABC transporter ATP-binding protein n=1 Tax=Atopobacter phocae TaxID=136492 RepID=UPI0004710BB6|nr:ABC transporter ATP-binding protein [Atopobacter phocae]
MTLIRYIRTYWKYALLIFACLSIRAFSELSLPDYTSRLVDVGIQQQGIESIVPREMSRELYTFIQDVSDDANRERLTQAYSVKDSMYVLKTSAEESQDVLEDAIRLPLVVLGGMMKQQDVSFEAMLERTNQSTFSPEQLAPLLKEAQALTDGVSEGLLDQQAIEVLKADAVYRGVDLNQQQMNYLIQTGVKMMGFTLLAGLATVVAGFFAAQVGAKIGRNKRQQLFQKVLRFSNAELDQFSTASLITRSTNDIQQIQVSITMFLTLAFFSPIMGIGSVVNAFRADTGMTWVMAVAVLIVGAFVGVVFGLVMPKFRKMQKIIDRLNLVSREFLTGQEEIRVFSREAHEEERFDEVSKELMQTQLFVTRFMQTMGPFMILVTNGIIALIVWVAAGQIDVGQMQLGQMMAFITYTMIMVQSFMFLTMLTIMIPRANVSAERIEDVLETPLSITNNDKTATPALPRGEMAFHGVDFRFKGASTDALSHIDFVAKPGETTAIIGSTGSGKSTLLNLLVRFYDVTNGSITIDGIDIRDMNVHDLRAHIGYVPQKGVLFSGDIAKNIKFSAPETISDETMERVAAIAQATEFIDEKPEGYQAPISQGGSNVSGGQKQRLAIARALAKEAQILLFDDSFSALDNQTDRRLRQELLTHYRDRTIIIVAQRISTILKADKIIVLDEGEIVGIGTHEELLARSTTYREIAESQLSQEELGEGGDTYGN